MNRIFTLLLFFVCSLCYGQIVITEISYNPPEGGVDSLEYIEVYNADAGPIDLTGYSFAQGVDYTFDNIMQAGEYFVIAVNANAMQSVLGVSANEFMGALTNGGETLELVDASGATVDLVEYSDSGAWPSSANGTDGAGGSIELCDITADNNDGANWRAADNGLGATADDKEYLGTPGGANTVICQETTFMEVSIIEASEVNADGVLVTPGMNVILQGIVHGVNTNPAGLQFTLIDVASNEGIGVYSGSDDLGYTVSEGDEVRITGTTGQFNGLSQISPIEIELVSSGNATATATPVTGLGEATESSLVVFENASLVDASQWSGTGSGFNLDVTNGTETIIVRIDNDVDLFSMSAPSGSGFNIAGLGGQYDDEGPVYLDGYQLLPRYESDISVSGSVNDINTGNSLRIAPNPATNNLVWTLEDHTVKILNVGVFNTSGQLMYQGLDRVVNVANYTPGTYVVKVTTEQGFNTQRFVKI